MDKGQEYLGILRPLDLYFLGGERNFQFGKAKEKTEYYLQSERLPQQSTLVGMLRFFILSQAGLLDENEFAGNQGAREANRQQNAAQRAQRDKLIGQSGFRAAAQLAAIDYGQLYSVSPVFLLHQAGDGWHRLVRTPLNHRRGEGIKTYRPFTMQAGYHTGNAGETLLPVDYRAKDGLADSYLDVDDGQGTLYGMADIFGQQEHTRIGRGLQEDGYFKLLYSYLQAGFAFGFYCRAEAGALPADAIVYLGQDKSAFHCTLQPTTGEGLSSLLARVGEQPGTPLAQVYVALSDLFLNLRAADYSHFHYTILAKKTFRTLNATGTTSDYLATRQKSSLFQLVRAGSVFYVDAEGADYLQQALKQPGLQQVGFNYAVKMGGHKE